MTTQKNLAQTDPWRGLNARQQTYMQAIYFTDQARGPLRFHWMENVVTLAGLPRQRAGTAPRGGISEGHSFL